MPYQKLQSSSALKIIPSDSYDIPNHTAAYSGTANGSGTSKLVDSNQVFGNNMSGYIVYDYTGDAVTAVKSKDSDTQLSLYDNLIALGDNYAVFPNTHSGCVLYIGNGGNIKVTTSSGNTLVFNNIQDGTFMPISVSRVWKSETTASNIIALW